MGRSVKFGTIILLISLFGCEDESSRMGDGYFKKGQYQEAVNAYTEYLSLKPNNIKALYNRGRAYEELGEFEKALADFNRVLENDDNHIQAQLSIAKDDFRKKEYLDVIYKCDIVLERSPQNLQAHLLKGQAYQKEGELKQAMDSYNQAISINKDFGVAYLYRGSLRIYLKQRTAACNDFKIAESLNVQGASKAREDYCK